MSRTTSPSIVRSYRNDPETDPTCTDPLRARLSSLDTRPRQQIAPGRREHQRRHHAQDAGQRPEQHDEDEARDPAAHQNGCPTENWNVSGTPKIRLRRSTENPSCTLVRAPVESVLKSAPGSSE